jgi:serine phosphatase RsbU (regulator of sigma subunit)/CHASE3 domain sensor protein
MTLRARTLIASGVALVALVLMGLILLFQYGVTVVANLAVKEVVSPGVDSSAQLTLEQANGSGALSDYIMLRRAESLDEYRQSMGRATTILDGLRTDFADQPEILDAIAAARAAQRAWQKTDAEPSITLMEAGRRQRAMRETNSDEAWATYLTMTETSSALHDELNNLRDQVAEAGVSFTRILGISLLVVGLLVLLGLGLFFLGLQSWILRPLRHLRDDIQQAARESGHTSPIRPSGPPEIKAVGIDAELLRRGLVREIDEAQAAKEGLVQDAPLVASMQRELTAEVPTLPDGLLVAGSSQSAEGVVAGDWWDVVNRPDGSVALVVADVSGHGPDASVSALRVRSIMRAALAAGISPHATMAMAAGACEEDSHFVTAITIVVDLASDTLTWCNAGHHPGIIVTRDKGAALCEPTGPLISALGGEWSSRTHFFRPGDVVVAYTDGLVESRNADGDELESSMVSQLIRGMDAPVREHPDELISQLLAQVRHRAADWRRDDVTVIAASRRS